MSWILAVTPILTKDLEQMMNTAAVFKTKVYLNLLHRSKQGRFSCRIHNQTIKLGKWVKTLFPSLSTCFTETVTKFPTCQVQKYIPRQKAFFELTKALFQSKKPISRQLLVFKATAFLYISFSSTALVKPFVMQMIVQSFQPIKHTRGKLVLGSKQPEAVFKQ